MMRRTFIAVLMVLMAAGVHAEDLVTERRKDQFPKDPGYYVFPMPYSIPGVGYGAALLGFGMNMGDTYTDLYGFLLAGDITGAGTGVTDIHLLPKTLILDLTGIRFNAATVTSYSQRGMRTSEHDFTLMQFNQYQFGGARMTATFLDRRFEVYGGGYRLTGELGKIMDPNGNSIYDISDPVPWRTSVYGVGNRIDLTDDYYDPRQGLRLDVSRWWSPPASDRDPDYYRLEYNVSAYVPIGKRSTWVFNYFRSDAHVVRPGETDRNKVAQDQNLNCSTITDPAERAACEAVIDNIVAGNTYGNATSLGGTSHLRSYPDGRFQGAHAVFYGTEVRWTLTEEAHPFDIFIAKDIRTVLQIAMFYELGSVEDDRDALGDTYRASYGAGFRMITASGIVLRADVALGREGMETTVIFGYPWESF